MTAEQETELVAAIKDAFAGDNRNPFFDETSVVGRAGEHLRLGAALESIVGPNGRYRSGWRRGRFKYKNCEAVALAVRVHFAVNAEGWWRIKD